MKTFIIDDDPISSFLTEAVLQMEDFSKQIVTFSSAEESLNFLTENMETNVPEVIFLDLNMPSMNGWQFLQALSPHESTISKNCSIFILTSSIDLSEQKMAQEHSVVKGFISKPITEEHITSIKRNLAKVAA
ncbi:response regulator [Pontibacter beigongshangensis]|uniref:response regulator n=1 Tax=Pontibacter beigongshangensis TaxID=2574733 RepID=UPI0016507F3F|nr:response regulator [Pontibacter beigongshangensis]